MSGESVLHDALIDALRADSSLAALLADHSYSSESPVPSAVYEYVEQPVAAEAESNFPYVVVGDTTGAEFDTDDVNGQEHTVTLHIWDRYRGGKRVRDVADALYAALHTVAIAVAGRHTVYCYYEFGESVPDPDVRTQHRVTRFRIVTQET
jgi:hypothetical protein